MKVRLWTPGISNLLYKTINDNHTGGLEYGTIEKNTVCSVIQALIKQKNATIQVNPKVLAYYLLITNPKYIVEGDNVDNLLKSFCSYCDNLQDEVSFTLLSDACTSLGNKELALKYLDLIEVIQMKENPLIKAVIEDEEGIVLALITSDEDYTQLLRNDNTLMHLAHENGSINVIKILLEHGALESINSKNNKGNTPIHCLLESHKITEEKKLQILQDEFLQNIYNFSAVNNEGKTVLDYAQEYCSKVLASILLNLLPAPDSVIGTADATEGDIELQIVGILGDTNETNLL